MLTHDSATTDSATHDSATADSATADWRELVHRLNQRYRQEFDRAERLQAELEHIRASRAWRILCWWRRVKRWLSSKKHTAAEVFPSEPLDGPLPPASGRVSILIPFRNQAELLRNCLLSLRRTDYRRFEIILIDNGSSDPRTLRLLGRLRGRRRVRVVRCPGPFNFSRLANVGAEHARGDYLLFLNNDIEIRQGDWLERMLHVAGHPRVGVVGATLFYPDDTLQHAGIFPTSSGAWVHPHRGQRALPEEQVRCVPAVTAACLMIRRDLFAHMRGFDERFAVTWNDVDLCCRVRRHELLVAVTPYAQLTHFESLTRGYAVD